MWTFDNNGDINPVELLIEQFHSATHEIQFSMLVLYDCLKFSQVLLSTTSITFSLQCKKVYVAVRLYYSYIRKEKEEKIKEDLLCDKLHWAMLGDFSYFIHKKRKQSNFKTLINVFCKFVNKLREVKLCKLIQKAFQCKN
jgi:hypothetical protein